MSAISSNHPESGISTAPVAVGADVVSALANTMNSPAEALPYMARVAESVAGTVLPGGFPSGNAVLRALGLSASDAAIRPQTGEHFVSCAADATDVNVAPNRFNEVFGETIGDELRRIGCTRVSTSGDRVSLTLSNPHTENIRENGINAAVLGRNVSLDMTRNGNSISISNITGAELDVRGLPFNIGLPNVTLTPNGVSVYGVSFNVGSGPYDNVNNLLTRLGR
jgi:hypothetical protein